MPVVNAVKNVEHHSHVISFIIVLFRLQLVAASIVRILYSIKSERVLFLISKMVTGCYEHFFFLLLLVVSPLCNIFFLCVSSLWQAALSIALIVVEVFYRIINMPKYQSNWITHPSQHISCISIESKRLIFMTVIIFDCRRKKLNNFHWHFFFYCM